MSGPGLDELGVRICILGPSNSGKSTLAAAIGRARDLPVIHLDLLRHVPGTHWEERPDSEFAAAHDAAIRGERWVMDGNYSRWLAPRLARATGLIVLDASTPLSVLRYLRRTLVERERFGALPGTKDRVSSAMIRYIVGPGRMNRRRYRLVAEAAEMPTLLIPDRRALRRFCRDERVEAPRMAR